MTSNTKAKIYLGSNDSFSIADSGATAYGGAGINRVKISNGAHNITLDQNIKFVVLNQPLSSYTFRQTGNKVNIYQQANSDLVLSMPVQSDQGGTGIFFSNGFANITISNTGIMLIGDAPLSSTFASPSFPSLIPASPPQFTSTQAKIYLGQDDYFTISDIAAIAYGGAGIDHISLDATAREASLDQNIEQVTLPDNSTNYTFKQTGNKINIYAKESQSAILSISIQDDSDGTRIAFNDLAAFARIASNGRMYIGEAAVSQAEPTTLTLTPSTPSTDAQDAYINGTASNDLLIGGAGNDILRGGAGIDSMIGATGNDIFVIVGDLSSGGKTGSEIDAKILQSPLAGFNGKDLNEDQDGSAELIDGGEGNDTLYVYGTADLSKYKISNIENIEIRSDVTFSADQLKNIQKLNGDGNSTIRLSNTESNTQQTIDLSRLALSNINHINLGQNTAIQAPTPSFLGGAHILSGAGAINFTQSGLLDLQDYTQTYTLTIKDSNGNKINGPAKVDEVIFTGTNTPIKIGTNGDDFIYGHAYSETLIGGEGKDYILGGDGDDMIYGDRQRVDIRPSDTPTPIQTVAGNGFLINNLGGDAGFGESKLTPNDDESSNAIDITPIFGPAGLNFFGKRVYSLFLNNNGNITFSVPLEQYTPGVISAGVDQPIIAPFWADVDTRGQLTNTQHSTGNSQGSNRVWYDKDSTNKIFTATWDDVGYYNKHTDKTNAFQLRLIDKGNQNFDIEFRYEDINWVTGDRSSGSSGLGGSVARAGYSAGHSEGYYEMPQSGNQTAMLNLEQSGTFTFSVRNGITHQSSQNDVIVGGKGNDTIFGGEGADDQAVYTGKYSEYTITAIDGSLSIQDNYLFPRDGKDTIGPEVEYLQFADKTIKTELFFMRTAAEIFREQGRIGAPESDAGIFNTGKIRTMADFSKAAYLLQPWETATSAGKDINTFKPFSNIAYNRLINEGWRPLELNINMPDSAPVWLFDPFNVDELTESSSYQQMVSNGVADGYFTQANAGAFVARSKDSVVLSFRGTNDECLTPEGMLACPDKIDWFAMGKHYEKLSPLVSAIDAYIADPSNKVEHVYVTGHSLGGAMAIKYMMDHPGDKYSAVTFAAPGYIEFATPGYIEKAGESVIEIIKDLIISGVFQSLQAKTKLLASLASLVVDPTFSPADTERMLHLEINGDLVPDIGPHGGKTIHFEGDKTKVLIDSTDNHPMDYYQQIAWSVTADGWFNILKQANGAEVLLGGEKIQSDQEYFIVDGSISGDGGNGSIQASADNRLIDALIHGYEVYYGGKGNDYLAGGSDNELLLGGIGNDTLFGGGNTDTLIGGNGADKFRFSYTALLQEAGKIVQDFDQIADFLPGTDKIQLIYDQAQEALFSGLGPNDFFLGSGHLDSNRETPYFLYDLTSGVLSFNNPAQIFTSYKIASLTGVPTLSIQDMEFSQDIVADL